MARYRIIFEVEVNEGNPLNWIPDEVNFNLDDGESTDNWYIEEIEEKQNESR